MKSFQIVQAAALCSARDELHEKQASLAEGHVKEAMPFLTSTLKLAPAALRGLWRGGAKLLGGAASKPGGWQMFKNVMKPGAVRGRLGYGLTRPLADGSAPAGWLGQMGKKLMSSGRNARNAWNSSGMFGKAWDKAGIGGKSWMLTKDVVRGALPAYGAQQLLSGYNQSEALQDAYAQGGGEAMAYLKANPMKNLGMMFAGPATIGSKLQGIHPSFGPRTSNAFQGAYDFYKNDPSDSQIGERVSNDLHSRAGWRAWS